MSVVRPLDKGQRYFEALDAARCSGNWHEVPELLKKISKNAPGRQCLILTARAECRIAERIKNATTSTESGTVPEEDGLLDLIPTLLSAMEEEYSSPQDVFQAQVCLGWLHWTLSEPALASSRLPKDFEMTLQMLSGEGQILSSWTEVCIVKGGYMKGSAQAQAQAAGLDDALQTMSSILPWVSGRQSTSGSNPQLVTWTERFLAQSALLASEAALSQNPPSVRTFDFGLTSFRAWAAHVEMTRVATPPSVESDPGSGPESRPSMWKSYYEFLSTIIQHGYPYSAPGEGPRRVQLSTEFRRVEPVCENILLRNVKFPKAHSKNQQVEEWVEKVIRNWEVLCGPGWSDDDLGEGGQDAVSRNVLDILYRAATKTFHSTLILRRLFHVHASLAEFGLAMKAFDAYVDIVTNAKARAEHSEKRLDAVEDDETLIRTLSEAITVLCCFGSQKEAEKAKKVTTRLDDILSTLNAHGAVLGPDGEATEELVYLAENGKTVSAAAVSSGYRAVGVGLATWARWTPVNESRSLVQEAAATALEKSLAASAEQGPNASTSYALGLLLAEMRDLDAAIDHVRAGLVSTNVADDASQKSIAYSEDHDLLPLWHLLTLLLSAKQEFEAADGVCDAVLDLASGNPPMDDTASRNGQEDNEEQQRNAPTLGICDTQARHKESLLELRMTQLGLTEILHGPETALNHSDELFSLFGRLFAGLEVTEADAQAKNEVPPPPKVSTESVRTFRGSIFGRRKKHNKRAQAETELQRNGSVATGRKRHGSLRRKRHERNASLASATNTAAQGKHRRESEYIGASAGRMSPTAGHNESAAARQMLPAIPHNLKYSKEPPPVGHASQPPVQDIRLPPSYRFDSPTKAITRFPKLQAQRHALGLLIKIWVTVAGLYRRASLFDDAREALNEASEQATHVEALVAGQESSARAMADAGWGGAKSSDELWADICAERGFLAEAQSQPHEAMRHFEDGLMYFHDHPRATIGLASLLLNVYDETLAPEESDPESDPGASSVSLVSTAGLPEDTLKVSKKPVPSGKDTPETLNRLAARDRAYGLLSSLTKLGSSWDDSEAWFTLSKAYEQGDQVEKAQEILWWCVELEDRRPIRHWRNVGSGGYVL